MTEDEKNKVAGRIIAIRDTLFEVMELNNLDHTKRTKALETALADAVELAQEGWSYVSDYFREKWEYEKRLAELIVVLHPLDLGKFHE
jgi:hypothetical protein